VPTPEVIATLAANRRAAIEMVQTKGKRATRALLEDAERDLTKRLRQAEGLGGARKGTFSAVQMRSALHQVRATLRTLQRGLKTTVLDNGQEAAEAAGAHTLKYLHHAGEEFRGIVKPLPLHEASMFDAAKMGTEASILHRLMGTDERAGILQRYSVATVEQFERELQLGMLTGKTWEEMRAALVDKSPFLQQAPAHWAERIVRTEVMGAYNRASWESVRAADEQLGDMTKILSATFDDRTGADSYAVHGQIRRPAEAFEWWEGIYQHPPNRPNDREVVVPHRIAWPIPGNLRWRSAGEISARWHYEGRKGAPPGRPNMTTVPLGQFGRLAGKGGG
jgi:hypothetical protein